MISKTSLLVLAAVSGLATGACGSKAGGAGAVDYSVSAQRNYEKGLKELEDKDWLAASKYFSFIKSRFPYSKYAVLAELRLADAQFGADQYLEAIDSYRLFIKFHPTHEMVSNGYASFRIGEGYFKQLSGDFWMFPPSSEKDQSSTEDAANELKTFLDKYPDSPYRDKAKDILKNVNKRLADHEWYVARYYWEHDKPTGTVFRLRRLLERYRGVGYDEEALWLLGRAYVAAAMPDRARTPWSELVEKFPSSTHAGAARTALASLKGGGQSSAPVPGGSAAPTPPSRSTAPAPSPSAAPSPSRSTAPAPSPVPTDKAPAPGPTPPGDAPPGMPTQAPPQPK
ncbi:MAG TPA: outer membrane protein assembly factor BamD [Kofleriaceae bacterium]|nr:outer membrane protein assembly factor BamD [Kofleriaceae bacterium]